jgi:hypothetical protein
METSRHISTHIDRAPKEVYDFASNPENLPQWASGLSNSTVEVVDGQWVTDSPMGRILIDFAPANDFGVLDHDVTVPSGQTFHNPMRVMPDGDGAEVVFTLRRQPEMTDADFERDATTIAGDLATLKGLLERG